MGGVLDNAKAESALGEPYHPFCNIPKLNKS